MGSECTDLEAGLMDPGGQLRHFLPVAVVQMDARLLKVALQELANQQRLPCVPFQGQWGVCCALAPMCRACRGMTVAVQSIVTVQGLHQSIVQTFVVIQLMHIPCKAEKKDCEKCVLAMRNGS